MQVVGFLISKKSPFREIKENEVQQVVDEVIAFLDKNVKEDSSSKIKMYPRALPKPELYLQRP